MVLFNNVAKEIFGNCNNPRVISAPNNRIEGWCYEHLLLRGPVRAPEA